MDWRKRASHISPFISIHSVTAILRATLYFVVATAILGSLRLFPAALLAKLPFEEQKHDEHGKSVVPKQKHCTAHTKSHLVLVELLVKVLDAIKLLRLFLRSKFGSTLVTFLTRRGTLQISA